MIGRGYRPIGKAIGYVFSLMNIKSDKRSGANVLLDRHQAVTIIIQILKDVSLERV